MNKSLGITLGIALVLGIVAGGLFWMNKKPTASSGIPDMLVVDAPKAGSVVASPLSVKGSARGTFYFEASFPIELQDANRQEIAVVPAQAQAHPNFAEQNLGGQGEWMTENFVPFIATLTFEKPTTPTGFLVFKKDNPSGLPEHDQKFEMPVMFE